MTGRPRGSSKNLGALRALHGGGRIAPIARAHLKHEGMIDKSGSITMKGLQYLVATAMEIGTRETALLAVLYVHRVSQNGGDLMPVDRDLLRRFAAKCIGERHLSNTISMLRRRGFVSIVGHGLYMLTDEGLERSVKHGADLEKIEEAMFDPAGAGT